MKLKKVEVESVIKAIRFTSIKNTVRESKLDESIKNDLIKQIEMVQRYHTQPIKINIENKFPF